MFFRSQLVLLFSCLLFVFSAHAERMTYQKKDVSLKQAFAALKKQTQLKYQSQDYNKRWQQSGDETFTDIPSRPAYGTTRACDHFYQKSSVLVAKGDYVRLQDLSIRFDVNSWKKLAIKRMQSYLYASNLGLIWKANNFF